MKAVTTAAIVIVLAGIFVSAQNPVPNADFENGITGWTLVRFNDPLGKTGARIADVNGNGDGSTAIYAEFQTLTSVMSATYDSTKFPLKAGTYPLTADVSWEKAVTTPIPSASVNRVEFRVINVTNNSTVANVRITVPNQTGLIERATLKTTVTIPSADTHKLQLFLRHSNLAGLPFICNVDDIAIGEFGGTCSSGGSAKNGGTLDLKLNAVGAGNKSYFAGTSLGKGPIPLDTRKINLFPDTVLSVSTSGLLPSVFSAYNGILPNSGSATAKLNIPASPALVGLRIYSAFLTIDPAAPSGVLTISNTNTTEIQ